GLSFALMRFVIWGIEAVCRWLEKRPQYRNRRMIFWISKYVIFNIVYIPIVIAFREMLFVRAVSDTMMIIVVLGGQIALFIYDRAYDYVQAHLWGKLRGRMMG